MEEDSHPSCVNEDAEGENSLQKTSVGVVRPPRPCPKSKLSPDRSKRHLRSGLTPRRNDLYAPSYSGQTARHRGICPLTHCYQHTPKGGQGLADSLEAYMVSGADMAQPSETEHKYRQARRLDVASRRWRSSDKLLPEASSVTRGTSLPSVRNPDSAEPENQETQPYFLPRMLSEPATTGGDARSQTEFEAFSLSDLEPCIDLCSLNFTRNSHVPMVIPCSIVQATNDLNMITTTTKVFQDPSQCHGNEFSDSESIVEDMMLKGHVNYTATIEDTTKESNSLIPKLERTSLLQGAKTASASPAPSITMMAPGLVSSAALQSAVPDPLSILPQPATAPRSETVQSPAVPLPSAVPLTPPPPPTSAPPTISPSETLQPLVVPPTPLAPPVPEHIPSPKVTSQPPPPPPPPRQESPTTSSQASRQRRHSSNIDLRLATGQLQSRRHLTLAKSKSSWRLQAAKARESVASLLSFTKSKDKELTHFAMAKAGIGSNKKSTCFKSEPSLSDQDRWESSTRQVEPDSDSSTGHLIPTPKFACSLSKGSPCHKSTPELSAQSQSNVDVSNDESDDSMVTEELESGQGNSVSSLSIRLYVNDVNMSDASSAEESESSPVKGDYLASTLQDVSITPKSYVDSRLAEDCVSDSVSLGAVIRQLDQPDSVKEESDISTRFIPSARPDGYVTSYRNGVMLSDVNNLSHQGLSKSYEDVQKLSERCRCVVEQSTSPGLREGRLSLSEEVLTKYGKDRHVSGKRLSCQSEETPEALLSQSHRTSASFSSSLKRTLTAVRKHLDSKRARSPTKDDKQSCTAVSSKDHSITNTLGLSQVINVSEPTICWPSGEDHNITSDTTSVILGTDIQCVETNGALPQFNEEEKGNIDSCSIGAAANSIKSVTDLHCECLTAATTSTTTTTIPAATATSTAPSDTGIILKPVIHRRFSSSQFNTKQMDDTRDTTDTVCLNGQVGGAMDTVTFPGPANLILSNDVEANPENVDIHHEKLIGVDKNSPAHWRHVVSINPDKSRDDFQNQNDALIRIPTCTIEWERQTGVITRSLEATNQVDDVLLADTPGSLGRPGIIIDKENLVPPYLQRRDSTSSVDSDFSVTSSRSEARGRSEKSRRVQNLLANHLFKKHLEKHSDVLERRMFRLHKRGIRKALSSFDLSSSQSTQVGNVISQLLEGSAVENNNNNINNIINNRYIGNSSDGDSETPLNNVGVHSEVSEHITTPVTSVSSADTNESDSLFSKKENPSPLGKQTEERQLERKMLKKAASSVHSNQPSTKHGPWRHALSEMNAHGSRGNRRNSLACSSPRMEQLQNDVTSQSSETAVHPSWTNRRHRMHIPSFKEFKKQKSYTEIVESEDDEGSNNLNRSDTIRCQTNDIYVIDEDDNDVKAIKNNSSARKSGGRKTNTLFSHPDIVVTVDDVEAIRSGVSADSKKVWRSSAASRSTSYQKLMDNRENMSQPAPSLGHTKNANFPRYFQEEFSNMENNSPSVKDFRDVSGKVPTLGSEEGDIEGDIIIASNSDLHTSTPFLPLFKSSQSNLTEEELSSEIEMDDKKNTLTNLVRDPINIQPSREHMPLGNSVASISPHNHGENDYSGRSKQFFGFGNTSSPGGDLKYSNTFMGSLGFSINPDLLCASSDLSRSHDCHSVRDVVSHDGRNPLLPECMAQEVEGDDAVDNESSGTVVQIQDEVISQFPTPDGQILVEELTHHQGSVCEPQGENSLHGKAHNNIKVLPDAGDDGRDEYMTDNLPSGGSSPRQDVRKGDIRATSQEEAGAESIDLHIPIPGSDEDDEGNDVTCEYGQWMPESTGQHSVTTEGFNDNVFLSDAPQSRSPSTSNSDSDQSNKTAVLRSTSDVSATAIDERERRRRDRRERPYKSDPFGGTNRLPHHHSLNTGLYKSPSVSTSCSFPSLEELVEYSDSASYFEEEDEDEDEETRKRRYRLSTISNISTASEDSGVSGHLIAETCLDSAVTGHPKRSTPSCPTCPSYSHDKTPRGDPSPAREVSNTATTPCKRCLLRIRERKETIQEIAETEKRYGRDLQVLKEEFYRPMKATSLLTLDQLDSIFINLEELVHVHKQFMSKLTTALVAAVRAGDEDFTDVNIGNAFIESSTMFLAFENYCVHQAQSSSLLEQLEREKELLRVFLQVAQNENPKLRRMHLKSFLMVPVQRVTKYPLLLSRLCKVTPSHNADRDNLKQAQENIEDILDHINSRAHVPPPGTKRRTMDLHGYNLSDKIEVNRVALEVLGWTKKDVCDIVTSRLWYGQVPDASWASKRARNVKFTMIHAVLLTHGRPLDSPSVGQMPLSPRDTPSVVQAAMVLVREKAGKFQTIRDPLLMDRCVITVEPEYDHVIEVHEQGRETYLFKGEQSKETAVWTRQLRRLSQNLGYWRRRRNGLANIMLRTS